MFCRLSRGRNFTITGQPLPCTFRDIRDAAERCICELPTDAVERLLTDLDDAFLGSVQNGDDLRNN